MNIAQSDVPRLPTDFYSVDSIKKNTGVYFLFNGDFLVYVGQATDVFSRVETHHKAGKKKFTFFSWMSVPSEDLNEVEAAYIAAYAPPLNGTIPPNSRYKPRKIVQSACWKKFRRHATGIELERWALPDHLKTGGAEPSKYYDLQGLLFGIAAADRLTQEAA